MDYGNVKNLKEYVKKIAKKNRILHMVASTLYNLPDVLENKYNEELAHKKADYYLISFPKCGRTWVRLMIGKYIQEKYKLDHVEKAEVLELTPLATYDKQIPTIRITHDDNPQFKTPSEIKSSKRRYKNKKVIFLVRDPRDVVISLYFQFLKRINRIENIPLNEFLKHERGSLKSIIYFYNAWFKNKEVPKDFLLVKYEDLHKQVYGENRGDELEIILKFLSFTDIDETIISETIKYTQFENMRRMELKGDFDSNNNRLKAINVNDEESFKTRKGKVGDYKSYFDETEIKYIDSMIENHLNNYFGY